MSEVATFPPVVMGQFEVRPTVRGWFLFEWQYDAHGNYVAVKRQELPLPRLQRMW